MIEIDNTIDLKVKADDMTKRIMEKVHSDKHLNAANKIFNAVNGINIDVLIDSVIYLTLKAYIDVCHEDDKKS